MGNLRCPRCREAFGHGTRCGNCGVHKARTVRKRPCRKGAGRAGGKRGRNSGNVSQHGKSS